MQTKNINEIKTFILDMDGTIYLGDQMIEGAIEFLKHLDANNIRYLFLTNNSSKNRDAYQQKLRRLGFEVDKTRIFTSGEATAIYLKAINNKAKIYLLGTKDLEEEFTSHGFDIVKARDEKPDFVVLGFDTTLSYEKLWMACDFIQDGVPFIATHPDINCPLAGGRYMPDAGAMIKLIEASTGIAPTVIGKPSHHIVDAIIDKYHLEKNEIAMVGDRLYTDIQLGVNSGITSILVYSGETTTEAYQQSKIKADFQFNSVKEIMEAL
ncbi:MAG: HAD family hydrolase [Clostridiales bacterium 38-18]|nr:MAG: HAD family hydrolase [Clostridiales bacterium 38-18]